MGRVAAIRVVRTSRGEVRRQTRYDALLDALEVAAGVVEKVGDGAVEVPGLKSAAGLVRQIVEIAKVRVPSRSWGRS